MTITSKLRRTLAVILALFVFTGMLSACTSNVVDSNDDGIKALPYDEAVEELNTFYKDIKPKTLTPRLDLDMEDAKPSDALSGIESYPITVDGNGDINIEIAAATEFSSSAPDDWLNVVAKKFNNEGYKVGEKTVSVSIRKITSGEVLTYMVDGGYRPDVYVPSNEAWGEMLKAKGFSFTKLTDRLAGNTAGILMKRDIYDKFIEKYNELTVDNVLNAAIAGDIVFGYTNPYTSSTGLNILSSMLYAFDNKNPLSEKSTQALISYQRNAPTAAYTTAELCNKAAKGVIGAMVMEEQSFVNKPELADYVYTPAGIRHDHPVYFFGNDAEKQQAAKLFVDYCLSDEMQKLATERGFNRHDDYKSQPNGMDGKGYLAAQNVWKINKNGGRPVIAVFVADTSGSMNYNSRIQGLKKSLLSSMQFIPSDCHIGLVHYDTNVYIDLPIKEFDDTQRAYFSSAVKDLTPGTDTATYSATLVGLKMIEDAMKKVPDAKPILFVLSDGEQNVGYNFKRFAPIAKGLGVQIYAIGYEMGSGGKSQMDGLAHINSEMDSINTDVDHIVDLFRNLFQVNT